MAELVPFRDLLDRLRTERPVGVDDYLAVGRLVARSRGASITELRDALAALLGRDRDGVARIRELFDELYGRVDDPEPSGEERLEEPEREIERPVPSTRDVLREATPGESTLLERVRASAKQGRDLASGKGRIATWAGILLVSIAMALVAREFFPSQPSQQAGPTPQDPAKPPTPTPQPESTEGPAPPVYATMPGCESWQPTSPSPFQYAASGLVFFGFLLLIARSSYRERGQAVRRTLRRDRLAAPEKNRTYDAPLATLSSRLIDTGPLRLAASALERRAQLDVPRSVDETVRAGLLPVLVLGPRRGIARILVLQEAGPAAEAYQPLFDSFAASLEGQGMEVERLYFASDLSAVSRRPGAKTEPLLRLTRHLTDRPLVVLSTGEITPSTTAELERLFEPWPAKVLLSPLADRTRVAPGLLDRRTPLPVFPLDSSGVREAARAIETGGASARTRAPARARILPTQTLRLRAMLAMAISPTYAIAERLRARFLPLVPRDILRATTGVVREGARGADGTAALEWFREMDATPRADRSPGSEEREVRSFLGELVEEVKPVSSPEGEETLAELRWRRDRALLAAGAEDPEARAAAKGELAELGRGPLRAELDVLVSDSKELRTTLEKTPDAPAPEIALAARARWALPRFPQIGAISLMAAVAGWGVGVFHKWRAQPFALDDEERTVYSDIELVRGLCQFDSFGAGWRDPEGRTLLLGTMSDAAGEAVVDRRGLELPSKRLVVLQLEEGPIRRTVKARLLDTQALYGPDHLVAAPMANGVIVGGPIVTAYAPDGLVVAFQVTWPGFSAGVLPGARAVGAADWAGFFPLQREEADRFDAYSFLTHSYTYSGSGDAVWAQAMHRNDAYRLSDGLLPGTSEDVILRLIGERPLATEPVVPEPKDPYPDTSPDGGEGGGGTQPQPPPPPPPEEMTISSFLTCDKPSGMRGPARVSGRLKRKVTDEELKKAFGTQAALPNRWTFQISPVEQNPVPGCFEFALPTNVKEPKDGEQVSIVFEAFDCSETIFAGCRQLSVRQVYRASLE